MSAAVASSPVQDLHRHDRTYQNYVSKVNRYFDKVQETQLPPVPSNSEDIEYVSKRAPASCWKAVPGCRLVISPHLQAPTVCLLLALLLIWSRSPVGHTTSRSDRRFQGPSVKRACVTNSD